MAAADLQPLQHTLLGGLGLLVLALVEDERRPGEDDEACRPAVLEPLHRALARLAKVAHRHHARYLRAQQRADAGASAGASPTHALRRVRPTTHREPPIGSRVGEGVRDRARQRVEPRVHSRLVRTADHVRLLRPCQHRRHL